MTVAEVSHRDPAYAAALRACAIANLVMFMIEGGVGVLIGSVALTADAVDFLEDAGVYALAVYAVLWTLRGRAIAGFVQGLAMAAVALVAIWLIVLRLQGGGVPTSTLMAVTAAGALAVNLYSSWRLARYRRGDASMRSIWLSTRNDVALNALTIVAAILIGSGSGVWPDILVGAIIAAINGHAAYEVLRLAWRELRVAPESG